MTISLVKRPTAQGTLWVCIDCTQLAVNGELPTDPQEGEPLPWALEPTLDVTPGIMTHDDYCTDAHGEECDCDRMSFSWRACEACGSNLGGERQAFVWWA